MEEQLEQQLELPGTEDATAAAAETRARSMGWSPKEKWRGDPAEWVDAAEFLDRGERLMPVLRANNRKLEEKTHNLETQNRTLAGQLEELRGSMNEFVEAQREMLSERLTQQRVDIRRQIREARESGNDAAIEQLEQTLDTNAEQQQKLKEQQTAQKRPAAPPPNPDHDAWVAENSWFQGSSREDQRKTALALQLAREAAQSNLRGKAFFDYIDEQMAESLPSPRPLPGKTENGRPSGAGSSGNSAYANLPAEAKAQAERDAARFVGPNKIFKTKAEWQAHFVKLYGA